VDGDPLAVVAVVELPEGVVCAELAAVEVPAVAVTVATVVVEGLPVAVVGLDLAVVPGPGPKIDGTTVRSTRYTPTRMTIISATVTNGLPFRRLPDPVVRTMRVRGFR